MKYVEKEIMAVDKPGGVLTLVEYPISTGTLRFGVRWGTVDQTITERSFKPLKTVTGRYMRQASAYKEFFKMSKALDTVQVSSVNQVPVKTVKY